MIIRSCEKTQDGTKRYLLSRVWNSALPVITYVGANPSKADNVIDDATVRKWVGFSQRLGFGGFDAVNLEPWVATKPGELNARDDLSDLYNLALLQNLRPPVIVCWGDCLRARHAAQRGLQILKTHAQVKTFRCWGFTQKGNPKHPLMLSYQTPLEVWK